MCGLKENEEGRQQSARNGLGQVRRTDTGQGGAEAGQPGGFDCTWGAQLERSGWLCVEAGRPGELGTRRWGFRTAPEVQGRGGGKGGGSVSKEPRLGLDGSWGAGGATAMQHRHPQTEAGADLGSRAVWGRPAQALGPLLPTPTAPAAWRPRGWAWLMREGFMAGGDTAGSLSRAQPAPSARASACLRCLLITWGGRKRPENLHPPPHPRQGRP